MTTVSREQTQPVSVTRPQPSLLKRIVPKRWYAHLILTVAAILMGIPMLYAVIVSTQGNAEVFAYQFTPGDKFARSWNVVWNQQQLWRDMLNSVFISVVMTTGKVILSLLAGLAFVYFRFPGKWLVFGFILLTLMMPTEVMAIALFRLVSGIGWGDTMAAITVPFLASATGAFLFRQHFANLPAELSEAAQLAGANPLVFLFRILIPLSWNAIGALCVIQFVYVWNMYLWPLIINREEDIKTIQVGLNSLNSVDAINELGTMTTGAIIATIPPIIVFILLQRQFMSGFAVSRDK